MFSLVLFWQASLLLDRLFTKICQDFVVFIRNSWLTFTCLNFTDTFSAKFTLKSMLWEFQYNKLGWLYNRVLFSLKKRYFYKIIEGEFIVDICNVFMQQFEAIVQKEDFYIQHSPALSELWPLTHLNMYHNAGSFNLMNKCLISWNLSHMNAN